MHPTLYPTHIPFIPSESNLPFLSYSDFNILPWKSNVKVTGEIKVWSHNVSLTFYRLTSLPFHVNRPSHSWDTTFSKFDLENPRSRTWRWTLKVTTWVQHSIDSHPFHSMSIDPSIPEIQHFQNLTLKIQGQGHMIMMLHNYRSRQFHRTSNGINPNQWFQRYGFRKVWPKCCLIWQVFGLWASPYGANGQRIMTLHNYRFRRVHETLNGVNPSSSFRDMRSAKSGPNLWQIWQVFGPWASP